MFTIDRYSSQNANIDLVRIVALYSSDSSVTSVNSASSCRMLLLTSSFSTTMMHSCIFCSVKFIGRGPHWYTRRVKEAIHIRLHPNNTNGDSGIEIPEAWKPTIRKHNSRPTTKQTCEGTTSNSRNNNEDQNAPITANHHATNSDT